jgi:hypothetical protein
MALTVSIDERFRHRTPPLSRAGDASRASDPADRGVGASVAVALSGPAQSSCSSGLRRRAAIRVEFCQVSG